MENDGHFQQSNISNLFYSKKSLYAKSAKIEKRKEIITSNPIPNMEPVGILGYTQLFKVYNKQSNALSFAKENGMGLMVFAFEGVAVGEGGRRNFLVCHPRKLWNNIKNRPLHYRCTYEVIPENCHCKLYFDLEYSKEFNPNLNGTQMVLAFIHIINSFIFQKFGITCNSENVLDLESSTDKKFSRHLIYNHPQLYFENNGHIGRFVKDICKYLKEVYEGEVQELKIPDINVFDIKKLFVKTESSVTLFCDQGVYSKNRNFRILGSTKLRKDSPLVISLENKYKPILHTKNEDENWFIDSLVTYVPPNIETN
ncbi:DNA-directed primase/polymerase protein [Armadillidium vulgare]|nr:DNA-directed primase/polymerase protein [Armadillidium vulgare]